MAHLRSAASIRPRLFGPIVRELVLASLACVHGACLRPSVPTAVTPSPHRRTLTIAEASTAPASPVGVPREPSFVLAAAGDVNLGRGCGQRLLSDPSYDPFRGIAPLWADADLRFVNLESGLSEQHGETQSPHHGLVFTGPPSGADALLRAGVGIVSTANNHAWDYTERGLFETLANLDRVQIAHTGTGSDEEDAYRPAVVHLNGLTVSFFAVTHVWNLGVFSDEEARHHVAWADVSRLRAALARARAESDFVLLSYHGDEEYLDGPLPKTREFVTEVMSLGVDVVLGHHPHVPQGVAWYGARPVFFSLGNFVFDTRATLPWTSASFIAKIRFRRGQPVEVSACPYRIDGFEPIALPAGNEQRERAFEQHLRSTSASVGGTNLGERDPLGCVALTPPAPSRVTKPDLPRRDPLRADRGSVQLGRR
jgi:poly-gamma-glutamate capsule biosynthesis protein CapA/YwtB (metallophosphatase superfamily)